MVEIILTVDDEPKTFKIPQTWGEVTVDEFCRLFSFNREILNPIEIALKTISIFTDIDEETLYMINTNDFNKLVEIVEFTTKDVESKMVESVTIDNETYYVKNDYSELTMGEVISIESILNDSNGNLFSSMDKLLCIFLRKKKDNGKLESFKPSFMMRAKLFKGLPIEEIYGLFVFFLNLENPSEKIMKDYLVNQ